ncbi:winged helix-turn-helix transcriptional regulator [Filimonas lacunae]|nr:helix-turn-helix domain-containing protein [Filimonas lacunae]
MIKEFLEKNEDLTACPVRDIMDRVSDKWSLLILVVLDEYGTLRFHQISNLLSAISQKVLTSTLKTLEADGLIARQVYPEVPPRVEYSITAIGSSLIPAVKALTDWAEVHMPAIKASRAAFKKR